MPASASNTVRSVALILAQLRLDAAGEAIANMIEKKVNTALESAAKKAADSLTAAAETTVAELQAASTAMTTSTTQMSATATSYRDALQHPVSNPAVGATTLDARIRAREGIKTRQILIDTWTPGVGLLPGISNTGLTDSANRAIQGMDDASDHRFVSAHWLNNGGILLELDSEGSTTWLNRPVTKATFLGHFAPDAAVKDWAFP